MSARASAPARSPCSSRRADVVRARASGIGSRRSRARGQAMGHPNEDLLRKGYEAFASYDLDTIQALFADDVVFHIPGKNPVSGDYKGKDEVFGFFAKMLTLSD